MIKFKRLKFCFLTISPFLLAASCNQVKMKIENSEKIKIDDKYKSHELFLEKNNLIPKTVVDKLFQIQFEKENKKIIENFLDTMPFGKDIFNIKVREAYILIIVCSLYYQSNMYEIYENNNEHKNIFKNAKNVCFGLAPFDNIKNDFTNEYKIVDVIDQIKIYYIGKILKIEVQYINS
ncbi:hypothetical protein RNN91_04545 [Mycoplasmopsis felis]|nr:hypothetical protein [Mycoplasmopsis felis]WQQ01581.1 hypothetical protein RRG54_03260 [Mycoplasmopsis felis]WQQ03861.1 hypothetical protein RRG47_03480 [Mycoplasmopsis felis]WRX06713.1 hypothetical protein O7984_00380 [Mycoplasmopsis felis]